ncbi:FUSC family protein [Rhizobium calliandrae]|uniref:FUSC family protein n=1 Tax=Rhizobium calliandrae TaxID=1312182 RepID=A0ABT7KE14_9HYPH|nr:FUSC family protein [Rhizobium calliandrae]MDL2406851.1 FUSC family protein [Rhizobium calliandrae]
MAMTPSGKPFEILTFPAGAWSFAIRIWLATTLALFVSFWLQLEAPSTAALTVSILAEPTRGQALEKAGYRLLATIVGVVASIVITGLFSQTRDLILAAFALWMGSSIFVAKLLDGNRAYAAVLSGYTVGLIATQQLDNPHQVFEVAISRGSSIAIGILATAVVNDLMFAPAQYPRFVAQLAALHRRVRAYAMSVSSREPCNTSTFLDLVRDIMVLGPSMASIGFDANGGPARNAAGQSAVVALAGELQAARILKISMSGAAVDIETAVAPQSRPGEIQGRRETHTAAWATKEFLRRDGGFRADFLALRSAKWPSQARRAPMFRSYRTAIESGVRAALWIAIASALFIWTGWPATSVSLSFVLLIAALGATTPSPRAFTAMALLGVPTAAFLTGILEFFILDGTDAFPLLAIAMAPFLIGATLCMTSQNLLWSSLGRVNLSFITIFLAPSNPQSYNPLTFLITGVFIFVAAAILLVAQILIPPVSDAKRRKRLVSSARDDLGRLRSESGQSPEEATFREMARLDQFISAGGTQDSGSLADVLSCFDQSAVMRLCDAKLLQLADGPMALLADQARAALIAQDAKALRTLAGAIRREVSSENPAASDIATILLTASNLIDGDRQVQPIPEIIR